MSRYILSLLLLFNFGLFSQDTIPLSLINSSPRVGDKIELGFDLSMISNAISLQFPSKTEEVENIFDKSGRTIFFKSFSINDTGTFTFGPFYFNFNNKEYVTDSVIVCVIEQLPEVEGVWIRYEEFEGDHFVIIEQKISKVVVIEKQLQAQTNDESLYSAVDLSTGLEEHPKNGVYIGLKQKNSRSYTTFNYGIVDPGFKYYYKKFQITFDEDYKGPFKLKKKHFEKLPKNVMVPTIVIEN